MISHRLRLVFIHIPKCAGTSITAAFKELDPEVEYGHDDWGYYLDYPSYFHFCVVRNPWDRALSSYHFIRKIISHWHDNRPNGENPHPDFQYLRHRSFDWFVRDLYDKRESLNLLAEQREIYHRSFDRQYPYVFDGDRMRVNCCLRFENVPENLTWFQEAYGMPPIPHWNKSRKSREYRSKYTPQTEQMIAEIYAKDVELFDYNF